LKEWLHLSSDKQTPAMKQDTAVILLVWTAGVVCGHQRTPPGVNPNTYQQQLHSDGLPPPIQPHFQPEHDQQPPQQIQQQQQQHHPQQPHQWQQQQVLIL
jgi:hypothetical protein